MQQHPNTRLQANRMGNLEFLQDLDYKSVSNILLFRQYKWGRMSRQTNTYGHASTEVISPYSIHNISSVEPAY